MTNKPENPPAFPWNGQGIFIPEKGMTLRDYFAAAALQGIAINGSFKYTAYQAEKAYKLADAMLKQREVQND
jgi:hypothetical protein